MGIVKQMWLEELDARGDQSPYEDDPAADFDYDQIAAADYQRQFKHKVMEVDLSPDEIEFRYERRGDKFVLKSWQNGKERTMRGTDDQLPQWVQDVLSVAKVSGHLRKTMQPPPDEILWFRTDAKRNLTVMIDLED